MKIGDQKKATMLGIVAVGAIGFLVIRMLPSGGPKVLRTASATAAAEQGAVNSAVAVPPMTLVNDPFSHPDLAEKKKLAPGGPSASAGTMGAGSTGGGVGAANQAGANQQGSSHSDAGPATGGSQDDAPANPFEGNVGSAGKGGPQIPAVKGNGMEVRPEGPIGPNGAKNAAAKQAPTRDPIVVTLNGVVSAGSSIAFIGIGKGEPAAYEIGQALPTVPPLRVADIQEGRVLLKYGTKSVELRVGHEAKI